MPQFTIRKNGFEEVRKKMLVRTFIGIAAGAAVGITISYINDTHKDEINVLPFVIPFMAVFAGYRMYRNTQKIKEIFNSYQLKVTTDLITREQLNLAPLSISVIEINEIIKNKSGSFTIKGLTASDIIYVPAQVDNTAELEASLNLLHPVTVKSTNPFWEKYSLVLVLVMLAFILGVFAATNKIIVGVSGTLLTGMMIWCMVFIQKSKNVDTRLKRSMWTILIVIFVVISTMLSKIAGISIF